MSSSLTGNTKIKVTQIYSQSFTRLEDKKSQFFVGHSKGIHLYDLKSKVFE
jgi:hypothetical protein